jgi:POT family proton-dependent oligopeptide transporter
MAYEGKPATQTLTYAGQAYEVTAAGRMEDLKARLIVAGKPYEFGPAKTGGLEIKDLPLGSTLPSISHL